MYLDQCGDTELNGPILLQSLGRHHGDANFVERGRSNKGSKRLRVRLPIELVGFLSL